MEICILGYHGCVCVFMDMCRFPETFVLDSLYLFLTNYTLKMNPNEITNSGGKRGGHKHIIKTYFHTFFRRSFC